MLFIVVHPRTTLYWYSRHSFWPFLLSAHPSMRVLLPDLEARAPRWAKLAAPLVQPQNSSPAGQGASTEPFLAPHHTTTTATDGAACRDVALPNLPRQPVRSYVSCASTTLVRRDEVDKGQAKGVEKKALGGEGGDGGRGEKGAHRGDTQYPQLLLSYAPDWIITIVLAAILYFVVNKVYGFRREFSLTGEFCRFAAAQKGHITTAFAHLALLFLPPFRYEYPASICA